MFQLDHMGYKLAGFSVLIGRLVRKFGSLLQRLSHRHCSHELLTLRNHGDAIEGQHRVPHLNFFAFSEGGLSIDTNFNLRQSLRPKHRPLDQRTINLVQKDIQILILEDNRIARLIGSATLTQGLDGGIVHGLILLRGLTGSSSSRLGRRLARAC